MDRRHFLLTLGAGLLAAAGCSDAASARTSSTTMRSTPSTGEPTPTAAPPATSATAAPALVRVPAPTGVLRQLPGPDTTLALTVDDGSSPEVVAAYAQFCRDTGTRITFFLNGVNPSWTEHAPLLRPMVESGQVQLANHTWSHPTITELSPSALVEQITRNERFLRNTYGVSGAPFFRPPYGTHNTSTDRIAADCGYRTITLWNGSLADSTVITEEYLVRMANQWFQPRAVVLGHANHVPVTHCYPQLVDVIKAHHLQTVTLNDVFSA